MQFDTEIFNPQEVKQGESLRYEVKHLNRFAVLDILGDRRNMSWAGEDTGERFKISAKDGLAESVQKFLTKGCRLNVKVYKIQDKKKFTQPE